MLFVFVMVALLGIAVITLVRNFLNGAVSPAPLGKSYHRAQDPVVFWVVQAFWFFIITGSLWAILMNVM